GPGTPGAFYVGPEGGWTALTNQADSTPGRTIVAPSLGFIGTLAPRSPAAMFDSGFNVGGRVGYQWGPWRLEEEYNYRNNGLSGLGHANTIDGVTIGGGRTFSGQRVSHAIMTNVIYDF